METRKEDIKESGFWERLKNSARRLREELKEDSVASNPRKPVDCCNPPVTEKMKKKTGTSSH
jgi:hypothetical protein